MEPMVSRMLIRLWDGFPEDEKVAHPHHVKQLLNPGPLRVALEEFSEGNINKLTGYPLPLRHWPLLHEHIYAFCGTLYKATAIDNEWAFSVLSGFLKRGNYNAGMWRLGYELLRASGDISKLVSMNNDDLEKARALKAKINSWRPEKHGNERSLFFGAYTSALEKIQFEDLKEATSGEAAVPRILNHVYQVLKGDWGRLGLMKIRTLILWAKGEVRGRVTKKRDAELRGAWSDIMPTDDELRLEAAKYTGKESKQTRKVTSNDDTDDEVSSGTTDNVNVEAFVSLLFLVPCK